jgi:glutaredoxin 3
MPEKHSIKVYSTATCPWCHVAKNFFKEKGFEFEDIDVGKDKKAAEEMIEKSGQMGVPVIEIDGQIIVGFNEAKIREILKIKD